MILERYWYLDMLLICSGVSVGGGAEGAQKRKAQSVFSTKEEEEIYCRHIVQIRIPNEFGKEEVSPDCPCCKLRQQLPVDKKLAAQQIAGKKKAREDLLEQAAWLATDIANLVESKRERQQEEEYLLKVIFRLREGEQKTRILPDMGLCADFP